MHILSLQRDSKGFHTGLDQVGKAGDAYFYYLEGKGSYPDPASRAQQADVHGPSLVVDPTKFSWLDSSWRRPPFRDLIIYELHVGTFTLEGTFRSACERFSLLNELGITAIEIMPISDFPGRRNWGYDGVLPYAPARCYGTPDDFRALVNCAHAHGLAVILDVVYSHLGPSGNYFSRFTPHYFNPRHHTPWGDSINFDSEMSGPVREFFLQNLLYWMKEFHIDGFRLDATHEIRDDSQNHILSEMSKAVHRNNGYIIAEDERNLESLLCNCWEGGMGFDAVWADDFHHTLRKTQTAEKSSYFADFDGSLAEALSVLENGWLYQGQISRRTGCSRGTPCRHLPPSQFVHCISNHDQVGNRVLGERLSQQISPPAYRVLSALLCLSPYTPLLFMGQEWAASTPFLYFTDHDIEVGKKVTEGRRREFLEFQKFSGFIPGETTPDPQMEESFLNSKLQWFESQKDKHAEVRALYTECLRLRRYIIPIPATRNNWSIHRLPWGAGAIHYRGRKADCLIVFDLMGGNAGNFDFGERRWSLIFSTEEKRFGGKGDIECTPSKRRIAFSEKGLVVLLSYVLQGSLR
ncbi:Malto-oligosyltrehalose trehalohydrolase [Candidatus Xiphinematobacter sp. Idaho Grape]|nr:Malto-oligosyltrehalose trehalohydrolase [Candidatus Xiphinematobacter sp. Idaho Grape]